MLRRRRRQRLEIAGWRDGLMATMTTRSRRVTERASSNVKRRAERALQILFVIEAISDLQTEQNRTGTWLEVPFPLLHRSRSRMLAAIGDRQGGFGRPIITSSSEHHGFTLMQLGSICALRSIPYLPRYLTLTTQQSLAPAPACKMNECPHLMPPPMANLQEG